jgi:methyl-accepting chemotaxis protein
MKSLTLLHKLLILSALAVLSTVVGGLFSVKSLGEVTQDAARIFEMNQVQRTQMDADMMHDSIRADVLLIQLGAQQNDDEARKAGVSGVAEHAARFREDLKRIGAEPNPAISAATQRVAPQVERYLRAAEAMAAVRSGQPLPALSAFLKDFEELEGGMEAFGDVIAAQSKAISDLATGQEVETSRRIVWGAVGAGVLLIGLCFVVVGSIRAPLREIARAAQQIADGDLRRAISTDGADDEIGDVARALSGVKLSLERLVNAEQVVIEAARRGQLDARGDAHELHGVYAELVEGVNQLLATTNAPLQEAKDVLSRAEARDLTVRMHGNYSGDFNLIKLATNNALGTLERAFGEVTTAADEVAAAAKQITATSAQVAQGASSQAASIEEVMSTLEEITSMSQQNASNAQESRGHAQGAAEIADQGTASMHRLSTAVDSIKEASDETAKIIKTIDEIAFQTNLLALNAAVEAARAGDAGRGFAVVAEEVRTLAMRSAEAAKNTTEVIERSLKKAEEGVSLNREARAAFEAISKQVKNIADVIAEIAESSQQQHASVARINKGVNTVSRETQQSAAASEQTASAAEELSAQAEMMRALVQQFRLERQAPTLGSKARAKRPARAVPPPLSGKFPSAPPPTHHGDGRELIPFKDDDDALLGTF